MKNLVNTIKKYREKKENKIFEANVLTELFNFFMNFYLKMNIE